jgi:hypothetical protein
MRENKVSQGSATKEDAKAGKKSLIERHWPPPTDPKEISLSWYKKFFIWGVIHWILGVSSIALPAVAASLKDNPAAPYFALAATIISGTIVFLGPKDEKHKFNVAWCILQKALLDGNEEEIKTAIQRGESIINAEAFQKYAPDLYTAGRKTPR